MSVSTEWRDRIVVDPAIHHGDPCIAGTRVLISVIIGSLAGDDTLEEILRSYPQLKREDIHAGLQFAAEVVNQFDFVPASR